MGYLRPTDGRTLCSRDCHRGRNPPSQEAGTDIWADFGTPLRAADAGRVYEVGGSILAATGFFVTIDLDDGRRIRYLHLWDRYVKRGDRVARGTVFARSGGSGYGSMTAAGGPGTVGRHVHVTLWPTHSYDFGTNARTLDFEQFADPIGSSASVGGVTSPEEDDMDISEIHNWRTDKLVGGVNRNILDMLVWLDQRQEQINDRQEQIVAQQAERDGDLSKLVAGIKADIAYIHTVSPVSLAQIYRAVGRGDITLTDAQVNAIGDRLNDSIVASLEVALRDDFDGILARLGKLPDDMLAKLKSKL